MINSRNGLAAAHAGSPQEPEFVRYYRGFRLVFLQNATSAASWPGTGTIEPVTDSAIAIWDRREGSGLVHTVEQKFNSSAEFFRSAEAIVDGVLNIPPRCGADMVG